MKKEVFRQHIRTAGKALSLFYFLVLVYWIIMTYSLFVKGLLTTPYCIEGIIQQIIHVSSQDIFLLSTDKLRLEQISKQLLFYIIFFFIILLTTFFSMYKWGQNSAGLIFFGSQIVMKKKKQLPNNYRYEKSVLRKIYRSIFYLLFVVFTIFFCVFSFKLTADIAASKYGVENIIRRDLTLSISKEQPLFINGEIQGITFDEASKAISIYYLKYIGLLYLEAILIFVFLFLFKGKKERLEVDSDNTR